MGDKVLNLQKKALTGNERKQVNSSNVNNAIKYLKQQNIIARGGDPSNASSNGHSAGTKKHKFHKKKIFDNYEQAEKYAMENGIDPQDIDHDNDEYSISWTEERVSNPSDKLNTRDNPDDMRGNEKGRYLKGDSSTAINSVEKLMDNPDYKKFIQAMLNKLKEKGYDMQDLYFKNGDFYYDLFDNLQRYGMNPSEAIKHIDEEYNEGDKIYGSTRSPEVEPEPALIPKGIKFYRANNEIKKGVNDVPLSQAGLNQKSSEDALSHASQEKDFQGNKNGEENDVAKEQEEQEYTGGDKAHTSKLKTKQNFEEGNDIEEGNPSKQKSNVKNVSIPDAKFEQEVKKGLARKKEQLKKQNSASSNPSPQPEQPKSQKKSVKELLDEFDKQHNI